MTNNSDRQVNVEKGKKGFQETEKAEPEALSLGDSAIGDVQPDPEHVLPNGQSIYLHAVPARDVFEPVTKTDEDGNYVTFYVGVENSEPSKDPVRDNSHLLTSMDFQVAGEDDNPRDLVREHAAVTGDLDRAILLYRTGDDPVQYRGERVGNDFYAEDGDDDDWKRADAAFIMPEDRADDDFEGYVDEINMAALGKRYTVIVSKDSPTGQHLSEVYDDYDETIVDPDDAVARAKAYADGRHGDLSEIFESAEFDDSDED